MSAAFAGDRDRYRPSVVFLLPVKDHLVAELEALGVACTCLGLAGESDLRWTLRLRTMLRRERVDILHLHSPYVAAFARLVVQTLPRHLRPGLVTTEHNPWNTYRWATRMANALTAPLDDAVIAVSEETRASLPRRRGARTVTLAHGVSVARIRGSLDDRAAIRRELGVTPDAFLFGTVANYHRKKDWPTLLRAARLAIDQRPELRFCAIGQGPLHTEVEALHRELMLSPQVVLTGYRADATRLMAAADGFVLASLWEGLPVALMEACALGLPIVASAVGGIPEQFTNEVDALLVAPGDPQVLAAALLRVADDHVLRQRLAAASLAHAEQFDAHGAVAAVEELYDDVVAARFPEHDSTMTGTLRR